MKKTHWSLYALIAFLGVVVLCFSFVDICPLLERVLPALKINKTTIIDFIRSLGAWGPVGSIGLMIMHSFIPFPAEFLTIANGMIFGSVMGIVYTWLGAMLGAYASFGLTRIFGRPFVARNLKPAQLEKLDKWILNQGTASLLLSRLIPFISFNLVNYGAGMTKISWWTFTWTTGVGILPMTIIMVTMMNNFRKFPWWSWIALLPAIIGLVYGVQSLRNSKTGSKEKRSKQ